MLIYTHCKKQDESVVGTVTHRSVTPPVNCTVQPTSKFTGLNCSLCQCVNVYMCTSVIDEMRKHSPTKLTWSAMHACCSIKNISTQHVLSKHKHWYYGLFSRQATPILLFQLQKIPIVLIAKVNGTHEKCAENKLSWVSDMYSQLQPDNYQP